MAAMAKLEAAQLHSWVDQLQSENQLLRRQLEDDEDAMLSAASAGAEAKRKGLTVLLELAEPSVDPSLLQLRRAAQRLLAREESSAGAQRMPQAKVQKFLRSADAAMAQDFEAAKLRQSALAMQLEVQRSELQVLREKQKRHEEIVIQEQDRYDAVVAERMKKIQLELYQLDQETTQLSSEVTSNGPATEALHRLLKFLTPDSLCRDVLWRWRCLLPP
ncbi:unnamed protein product [Cladocopium goreaui]|uniref:Uncharacterized protein n=1 Tax=Cladocopium goreaui TaxID=2562237 RepID=A0A9P1BKQ3_9DINO|nr:unnamed protein product [Cladocopium goreaui]